MKPVTFIVRQGWRQELSGAATFLRGLFRGLDEKRVSYKVLETGSGDPRTPSHRAQPERNCADAGRCGESFSRLALGYLCTLWEEYRQLRRHPVIGAHVLVVNEFGCETLPIAARMAGPTAFVVALAHTHPGRDTRAVHPVRRLVERMCHTVVSDVIYNSNAVKEEWRRKLGRGAVKGRVIWYGLAEPSPEVDIEYPSRPPNTIDFVCVARFVRWKGHEELLRAWSMARRATRSRIRLLLVGNGPTLSDVQKLASQLGIEDSVVFCGARANGGAFFAHADVGVQLSVEPEAFGFVLLEAMSRQRPVIASRLGGIPEVVEDEKTGLLVEPQDTEAVARAICRLSEEPQLRHAMGRMGYERWRRHFTLDRMIGDYVAYLESIA